MNISRFLFMAFFLVTSVAYANNDRSGVFFSTANCNPSMYAPLGSSKELLNPFDIPNTRSYTTNYGVDCYLVQHRYCVAWINPIVDISAERGTFWIPFTGNVFQTGGHELPLSAFLVGKTASEVSVKQPHYGSGIDSAWDRMFLGIPNAIISEILSANNASVARHNERVRAEALNSREKYLRVKYLIEMLKLTLPGMACPGSEQALQATNAAIKSELQAAVRTVERSRASSEGASFSSAQDPTWNRSDR